MIEPYVTEKQCARCGGCFPITEFRTKKDGTPISYCQPCAKTYSLAYYHRHKGDKQAAKKDESPTAWLLPRDERPLKEQLLDVTLRRWPALGPAANLVPSLGVAA